MELVKLVNPGEVIEVAGEPYILFFNEHDQLDIIHYEYDDA